MAYVNWRTGTSDKAEWDYKAKCFPTGLRIMLDGVEVEGKICAVQTGKEGWVERLKLDADGQLVMNYAEDDIVLERFTGCVVMIEP